METQSNNSKNVLNGNNIFTVRFRKGTGAVGNLTFAANDEKDAKKRANTFCAKHGFRFVFVKPFLTDLETWEFI